VYENVWINPKPCKVLNHFTVPVPSLPLTRRVVQEQQTLVKEYHEMAHLSRLG
jgi:hypothetical protein